MWALVQTIVVAIAVLVLASCGGGSSDNPPENPDTGLSINSDINTIDDVDPSINVIIENSPINTPVGITVLATDDDSGDEVRYSLADSAEGTFTIDEISGVISLSSSVDYESINQYTVTAVATSSDGSSTNTAFIVNVENAVGPELSQSFPTPKAIFLGESLDVYGKVDAATTELVISVEGGGSSITAVIDMENGQWRAENVPVVFGPSNQAVIRVAAQDASGEAEVIESHLDGRALLISPTAFALDKENDRAFVAEPMNGTIVLVELSSGNREIFLDFTRIDEIELPVALAYDVVLNRLLVADGFTGLLVAVDIESGESSIVSGPDNGSGAVLNAIYGLSLDSANGRALITAHSRNLGEELITEEIQSASGGFISPNYLFSVDLSSGDREVVSGPGVGAGPLWRSIGSLIYDVETDRLFLTGPNTTSDTGRGHSIYEVELESGARRVVSDDDSEGVRFQSLLSIDIDAEYNRLFVGDFAGVRLVDIETGVRVQLSGGPALDSEGVRLHAITPRGIVFDARENFLWVLGSRRGGIFKRPLDPISGELVTACEVGIGFFLDGAGGLTFDAQLNRLYSATWSSIYSIDPATSNRQSVSHQNLDTEFARISDMVFDVADRRIIFVDSSPGRVVSVDPVTGVRQVLSSAEVGDGDLFEVPKSIMVGEEGLFVIDSREEGETLVHIDQESGDRSLVSNISIRDNGYPSNLIPSDNRNQAYVVDEETLYLVNLDGSGMEVITNSEIGGDIEYMHFTDLVKSNAENQILVTGSAVESIVSIDTNTGDRAIVSSNDSSEGPDMFFPTDMVFDSNNNVLYFFDWQGKAIFAMDPKSGDRVVMSR